MKLNLKQGQGYTLYVEDDILDRQGIFYEANRKAMQSIEDILICVEKTKIFTDNANTLDEQMLEARLYKYEKNIVAINGSRGAGKTSRMLSLTKTLEKRRDGDCDDNNRYEQQKQILHDFPHIDKSRFIVLPPLDPTILEDGQSFLEVVLARIYNLVDEGWKNRGYTRTDNGRLETVKNDLVRHMQKFLTGIHAIHGDHGQYDPYQSDTMAQLHMVSYGMQLKLLLFHVVEETIELLNKLNGSGEKRNYLVIQLDDTDCQVRQAYKIIEDLRRYLSIPNVIIIMATDIDILHEILTQTFYQDFKDYLDHFRYSGDSLEGSQSMTLAKKYLDKLIAPNHVISLPSLDYIISGNMRKLEIVYDGLGDDDKDILKDERKDFPDNPPAQILHLIYRKTGMIFVAETEKDMVHPLIPTTLRGFLQFMDMLSEMEDLPPVKASVRNKPGKFSSELSERISVQKKNIQQFSDYFLRVWAPVKLTDHQVRCLWKIREVDPNLRYITIWNQLREIFPKYFNKTGSARRDSYYDLVQSFWSDGESMPELRMFSFAVQCCLTLLYHRSVLKEQEDALDRFSSAEGKFGSDCSQHFLCDYNWTACYLPDQFCLPDMRTSSGQSFWGPKKIQTFQVPLSSPLTTEEWKCTTEVPSIQHAFFHKEESGYRFLLLGIVNVFLRMNDEIPEVQELCRRCTPDQIYRLQEYAATFASNVEVQRILWKQWQSPMKGALPPEELLFNKVSCNNSILHYQIVFIYYSLDVLLSGIITGKENFGLPDEKCYLTQMAHLLFKDDNLGVSFLNSAMFCVQDGQEAPGVMKNFGDFYQNLLDIYNQRFKHSSEHRDTCDKISYS